MWWAQDPCGEGLKPLKGVKEELEILCFVGPAEGKSSAEPPHGT